ncbi:MAG: hypothetical protein IPO60_13350 [Flavobacteriales bacterium]|nr:hypothetical protein [Flavobacteriales bacterium]
MPLLSHPFRAYLRHLRHAGNRHDVHSPFVFTLVDQVLRKRTPRSEFTDIEKLRSKLLSDRRMITVTDLGAGSRRGNTQKRPFIDGHHAAEPTLDYFDQCLAKAHNDTVFIFDDIHWSTGMEEACCVSRHPK